MFISTNALSKMIKDQYKTNLRVGYLQDGLVIIGGEWAVWMDYEYVPNKIKGTIVELAGGLPGKDKLFSLSKEYPEPQHEIVTPDIIELFSEINIADNKLNISPIILDTYDSMRLLQTQDPLQNIVEVREKYLMLVDLSEVDLDIEGQPTGPCYAEDPYGKIYWYNDIGMLYVMPSKKRENPLFSILSEVKFDDKLLVRKEQKNSEEGSN